MECVPVAVESAGQIAISDERSLFDTSLLSAMAFASWRVLFYSLNIYSSEYTKNIAADRRKKKEEEKREPPYSSSA
jgi:hypothetical protein